VEDDPAILKVSKIMLEGLGYRVLTADMPSKAIRIAQEHKGNIHLIMTDVIMPEMNGLELAKKVAKSILPIYPQIRCLFMSGYIAFLFHLWKIKVIFF
jgi:CheY-like chemotaxis protein